MQIVHLFWGLVCILSTCQVNAVDYNITLSDDGPVVLGGTITFKADLFPSVKNSTESYKYWWSDNSLKPHIYETEPTFNTTTYWSLNISPENYTVGIYEVEVVVSKRLMLWWWEITSIRTKFYVNQFLNGKIVISQPNNTATDSYVSPLSEANVTLDIRKGDLDHLKKATSLLTYWFIDCHYFGQTTELYLPYNFTVSDKSHQIDALVIASYNPPTTIAPWPTVAPIITTTSPNATVTNATISNTTDEIVTTTTSAENITGQTILTSTVAPTPPNDVESTSIFSVNNISLPYVCSNSSIIPPDPNKTYGYFSKKIDVRAPITNITVEGTNWIQPWAMLSLNITCNGTGPFNKCLHFHRGNYNITGNETCESAVRLNTCNFSIMHYFLEPSVYTILIILNNDISKQIYPLTINIYKVTTKPQLSVIVVPVSCSLAAVVLIIFGIAYYMQSRARFTVEVANFNFGQSNPEMEYKTFRERLRDSFNNALSPGSKRISGYKPLNSSSQNIQSK